MWTIIAFGEQFSNQFQHPSFLLHYVQKQKVKNHFNRQFDKIGMQANLIVFQKNCLEQNLITNQQEN